MNAARQKPSGVTGLRRGMAAAAPAETGLQPAAPLPTPENQPSKWSARIAMTATPEMKRELELARLDDGIEVTARLRAMITLWMQDDQHRWAVDALAKTLR